MPKDHFWFDKGQLVSKLARNPDGTARGDMTVDPDRKPAAIYNGDPQYVIGAFAGHLPDGTATATELNPNLSHIYAVSGQNLRHVELRRGFALFMRGTTSELADALMADIRNGLISIACVSSEAVRMDIRYLRVKAGSMKTVTILGLADSRNYWGSNHPHRPAAQAGKGEWHGAKVLEADYFGGDPPYFGSAVTIRHLVSILEDARGERAWL